MESTGPTTRSRAKSGVAVPSAAPSTRKKTVTTRSTRKPAGRAQDLATAEPDDTITHADVAESSAANQEQESTSAPGNDGCDVPATVSADAGPLAGLTPLPANSSTPGDYPGPTPGTVGASPVMPIKLESLWTPSMPGISEQQQRSANSSRPSTAAGSLGGAAGSSTPTAGVLDLAAMFISTPAPDTVQAATSPVEGLVAGGVEQQQHDDEFVEQPFGGFADAAAAAGAGAHNDAQMQEEAAGVEQPFGFGSPAAVAAVADASVAELDDATEPSAPLLPISPAVLPAVSPARSRRTTPRRAAAARSPAPSPGLAAAAAQRSPAPSAATAGSPLPGSPFPEDDGDLPPAEDEYPDEVALRQEAIAQGLLLQSPEAPAAPPAAFAADAAGSDDGMAVDSDQEQGAEQQGQAGAAADMEAEQEGSEEQLDFGESEELPATDDCEADLAELAALEAVMDAEVAAAEAAQQQQVQGAADELPAAAEVEQEDAAMKDYESPAAAAEPAAACPTPANVKPATPAAAAIAGADLAAVSPEVVALPVATSPSRTASGTSTTAARPKSALAKPREGSVGASARKSAHVVVPGPSPKSSAKTGSSSRQGADDGSSPGHTPYPSKAKVKAATAAADRSCTLVAAAADAAAGSKAGAGASTSSSISHKKEVGYARAHSALKHYASNSSTEQQVGSTAGSFAKKAAAASPGVSSRLLQPTASYMAKTKAAAAADADPLVWSPPLTPEASDAAVAQGGSGAAAAAGRPRLASKVVVPSPAAGKAGGEPSMAALKRSIKEKMAAKAQATLDEHGAGEVRDVHELRGSKPKAAKAKAPPAAEAELDFDDEEGYGEEYEEAYGDQDAAGELADSLAGLRMGGLPAGPLRGVAGPSGKHLVFDEEGKPKETPSSKLRQAPRHTYFDEEGRPTQAPPARPVWR